MPHDDRLSAEDVSGDEQELRPGVGLNNGQFIITKFLASGGFGMTYLAKDNLDRDVVVKECFPGAICRRQSTRVIPASASSADQFQSVVQLFIREAKAMAKLVHPNIVGIHQIFEDNGTAYMALDFVDGCDLMDVIEDETLEVSPERLLLWLRKLLTAIEFVHNNDVLHRDISPDNILLDRHDNPILIDFGAAREHATRASRALTTLRVVKDGYSPQEFYVAGSQQNRSSDLYALGATFYHLLTGIAPPNSQERLAALAEGREDPYRPLLENAEGYSRALLASINKALQILPTDRFQSALEWIVCIDAAGPFVQPEPLAIDFNSIRVEVKRIAEEFDDPGMPDEGIRAALSAPLPRKRGRELDVPKQEMSPEVHAAPVEHVEMTWTAKPESEVVMDLPHAEEHGFEVPHQFRGPMRLLAASVLVGVVFGGYALMGDSKSPDRTAAVAILTDGAAEVEAEADPAMTESLTGNSDATENTQDTADELTDRPRARAASAEGNE